MTLSVTHSHSTQSWVGASLARIFCAGALLLLASGANAQAPILTLTVPGRNANAASTTRNVTVGFSELLSNNASTQQALKVFSQRRGGKKIGPTTVQGTTITFDPSTDFVPGETIYGTVTSGVQSTTGVATKPYVFQFTTAAASGPGTFSGGSEVPVTNAPNSVAAGDIDADGDIDLLSINGIGSGSIRLNNGAGTFSVGADVPIGEQSQSLVLGDMDGDGDLDLVTVGRGAAVRLNDGTGRFGSGQISALSSTLAISVALGDIDGDGDLDLVATHEPSGLSVRLNNGAGVLGGSQDLQTGSNPREVVLGDIDGDGDLDLLMALDLFTYGTVAVKTNDGAGNFSGTWEYPVSAGAKGLALGDVDSDGDLDVLTANALNDKVSVRLNNGNGIFTGTQEVPVGVYPTSVTVGDVDGDGDLDLLTTSWTNSNFSSLISVRLNDNTGSFKTTGQEVAVGGGPNRLVLNDLDGDGDLDFATANVNFNQSKLSVRLNQAAPTGTLAVTSTSPARNALTVPRTTNVAAAFNEALSTGASTQQALAVFSPQTGKKVGNTTVSGNALTFNPTADFKPGETVFASVTAATQNSSGANLSLPKVFQFTTATSPSSGLFGAGSDVSVVDPNSGGRPTKVITGDVDGDGDLDFVTSNLSGSRVAVRLNAGNGTFTEGQQVPVVSTPLNLVLGDVDNDGDLDLLVAGQSNAVSIRLNNGQGIFTGTQAIAPGFRGSFAGLTLYDIDGDGDLDLLTSYTTNSSSQDGLVGVFRNDGVGTFSRSQEIALSTYPFSSKPFEVTVGDVDGDGDGDLLVGSELGISIRLNNGLGIFASAGQEIAAGSWLVRLGDVDADGDLDLLLGSAGNSCQIYLNNGLGAFSQKQQLIISGFFLDFALGDVDGDGNLDLVFPRRDAKEASIYRNDGTGTFSSGQVVTVGDGPYSAALGDLDADGTLDLLVANYFSNTVSVRLNKGVLANAPTQLTQQVSVYPNPAHTSVRLLLPAELAKQRLQVQLVNTLGQTVLTQTLGAQATPEVTLAPLAAGVYSLQIRTNQGVVTKRLVVE